jgi:hypothetical protein
VLGWVKPFLVFEFVEQGPVDSIDASLFQPVLPNGAQDFTGLLFTHSADEILDKLDVLSGSRENPFEAAVRDSENAVCTIFGAIDDLNVFHDLTVGWGVIDLSEYRDSLP